MAVLASYLNDHVRATRLSVALRDRFLSVACDGWEDLLRTAARRPVSIAVVDPKLASDADSLRTLRRMYGSMAIVAYVAIPPTTEFDLFEYGRLGLDAVVVKDKSDAPRMLQATIERAEARGMLDPIRRALGDLNPTVRDAILMAVSRAQERLSPTSMARALGISRTHLGHQLATAVCPSPTQLVVWGRLIVASRMLEDERRSANAVAAALEFPSGSAFRNACQRYLQATPGDIRERGGATYAIGRFFQAARREAPVLQPPRESSALSNA